VKIRGQIGAMKRRLKTFGMWLSIGTLFLTIALWATGFMGMMLECKLRFFDGTAILLASDGNELAVLMNSVDPLFIDACYHGAVVRRDPYQFPTLIPRFFGSTYDEFGLTRLFLPY
jgi:hypothetical protein